MKLCSQENGSNTEHSTEKSKTQNGERSKPGQYNELFLTVLIFYVSLC